MAKKANPLYAVTNKGKDVEEVSHYLELLITKLGLAPVIDFFDSLLNFLLEQITSYAAFVAMKEFLDQLVEKIDALYAQFDPVFATFFPSALESLFKKEKNESGS